VPLWERQEHREEPLDWLINSCCWLTHLANYSAFITLEEPYRNHCPQRFQYYCSCVRLSYRGNRALTSHCHGYGPLTVQAVPHMLLSEAPSNNGPLRLSGVMSQYGGHLMLPLHSANVNCHSQYVLVAWMHLFSSDCSVPLQTYVCWIPLIWIQTLAFPWCNSSICNTNGVHKMHISILHTSEMRHFITVFHFVVRSVDLCKFYNYHKLLFPR
jgi:hypothetical protein